MREIELEAYVAGVSWGRIARRMGLDPETYCNERHPHLLLVKPFYQGFLTAWFPRKEDNTMPLTNAGTLDVCWMKVADLEKFSATFDIVEISSSDSKWFFVVTDLEAEVEFGNPGQKLMFSLDRGARDADISAAIEALPISGVWVKKIPIKGKSGHFFFDLTTEERTDPALETDPFNEDFLLEAYQDATRKAYGVRSQTDPFAEYGETLKRPK